MSPRAALAAVLGLWAVTGALLAGVVALGRLLERAGERADRLAGAMQRFEEQTEHLDSDLAALEERLEGTGGAFDDAAARLAVLGERSRSHPA